MKKLLALGAIFSSLAVLPQTAQATDIGPTNFNVKVNLTAKCTLGVAIPDLDFGTYDAITGGSSTSPATSQFNITCTRGLNNPSYTFDAAKGGTNGVIQGLNYTLAANSTETAPGTTATPGVAGTAATKQITITGTMPANQAGGECGTTAAACAGAVTDVRTLTITY